MYFDSRQRLALFIDGPNLYSAAITLGFGIDYRKLLELFRSKGRFVRAFYYTATAANSHEDSPIQPLVDWLDYNGYTVVTKPSKKFVDSATGQHKIKGNMDVELTIDMLEMAGHIDHAVLFSGDGDFRRLVEAVQRRGVHVTVVSTYSMVADELRRQADTYLELREIVELVSRDGYEKMSRPAMERTPTPADPDPEPLDEAYGNA